MKIPSFFLAHGNPMRALQLDPYSQLLNQIGEKLNSIEAVLVVSAHWETTGTFITAMQNPKTIHDFAGFPKELFAVQYPALGHPQLAKKISENYRKNTNIQLDNSNWGIDHGAWSLLVHLWPKANIPVLQLSLDRTKSPEFHFSLGRELSELRKQNICIIGSGNIVHNLRAMNWDPSAPAHTWASNYENWSLENTKKKNWPELINNFHSTTEGKNAFFTLEHYLPFLFSCGTCLDEDKVEVLYSGIEHSSLSMTSFLFGEKL